MAKSTTIKPPTIVRQDLDWGVRLLLRPFPGDAHYMSMEISAEIEQANSTRRLPQVRILFNGPPIPSPFGLVQLRAWNDALRLVTEEARKIYDQLVGNKKPRSKVRGKKVTGR